MVSDEWWIYHLTENGWVAGSYKHDFQKVVEVNPPQNTFLTRKYYERLGHAKASMEIGFDNESGLSSKVQDLLKTHPHPEQFKNYK